MRIAWTIMTVLVAAGIGCSGSLATPTPVPALTATATRVPTATAQPTPTADLSGYQRARLESSRGFALEIPQTLKIDRIDAGMYVTDERLIYTFFTASYDGSSPLEERIHRFLDILEERGAAFDRGDPYDAELAGREATALDYSGIFIAFAVTGQVVAAKTDDGRVFIAVGMAKTTKDKQAWNNLGQPVFEQMLGTLSFQETSAACVISTDESYGYSEDNPIKVGGGDFEGPSREQDYLANLRGPNGEELTYTRSGSSPSGDVVLDEYQVTGPGVDEVLFINEGNFSDPKAPAGFTCAGPFPLSPP